MTLFTCLLGGSAALFVCLFVCIRFNGSNEIRQLYCGVYLLCYLSNYNGVWAETNCLYVVNWSTGRSFDSSFWFTLFYRYQRVSPDYNPLSSNGSKSSFRCREEGESGTKTILTTTNGIGGGFRFRSPSKPPSQENNNTNHYNTNNNNSTTTTASPLRDNNNNNNLSSGRGGGGGGGDVLLQLQWGHKKRARLSRTEIRSLTVNDDSSSSSSFHRRAGAGSPFIDKPPPPPPHSHPSNATSTSTRPFNLRTKDSSGFINNRY